MRGTDTVLLMVVTYIIKDVFNECVDFSWELRSRIDSGLYKVSKTKLKKNDFTYVYRCKAERARSSAWGK